jgi:hypothetical protein
MRLSIYCAALTVALTLLAVPATADDAAVAGRGILDANKSAVVTVKMVVKMEFSMAGRGSQEQESQEEVTGTVIDPSGLTVVSLTETDPSAMLNAMYGDQMEGFHITTDIDEIKIMQEGGKEIDAKVILRDQDFDIAFIRPKEPVEEPLAAVNVTDLGAPEMLDEVVFLNRLGKIANRAYAASVDRVEGIVTKPRTFYIPGRGDSSASLGSPCFTMDGKFVGVAMLRTLAPSGGARSMLSDSDDASMAIIRPIEDILESAEQVPPYGDEPTEEEETDAAGDAGAESEEGDA